MSVSVGAVSGPIKPVGGSVGGTEVEVCGGRGVLVGGGMGVSVGSGVFVGIGVAVGGTSVAVGGTGVSVGTGVAVFVGTDVLVGMAVEGIQGESSFGLLVGEFSTTGGCTIKTSTSSTAVPGFVKIILTNLAITGPNCARTVSEPETTPSNPAWSEL